MIEVNHLPIGGDPPESDQWVRVARSHDKFLVEVRERRHRPVIRFEPALETFERAIGRARQHAKRIGVTEIHAFGCKEVGKETAEKTRADGSLQRSS